TRAQDFLTLVERTHRGHLKLYIGFAAGVGKTYRMLEEARAMKKQGVDVVLGYVETHGRGETAALLEGLELLARGRIEYRDVNLDLAVEDLLERLKTGRIYPAEKVQWALDNFFQGHNLSTLRELSLREVAESLERSAARQPVSGDRAHLPATGRVMVCLSSHPP